MLSSSHISCIVNECIVNHLNNVLLFERTGGLYNDSKFNKWKGLFDSYGINYPHFYSEMVKRRISNDRFNIEAQARITVGHEIGHGLVDYIKDLGLDKSVLDKYGNLSVIVRCGGNKEQRIVEELGELSEDNG